RDSRSRRLPPRRRVDPSRRPRGDRRRDTRGSGGQVAVSTAQLPREMRQAAERHTWLDFAGVMLILVGFFNVIDGISAVSNSKYVSDHVLFSNLKAWGWFF